MPAPLALGCLLAVLAVLAATAPAAVAAEPPTDPRPGSPSEAVYGIQVDRARRDAAPGGRSGQASRSEQGVGSSAIVPGTRHERAQGGRGTAPEGGDRSGVAVALVLALVVLVAVGSGLVAARALRAG